VSVAIINSTNYRDFLNYKFEGLTTGFHYLDKDKAIGSDDFVVIAGSTGSGKSTIALYMACNIAISGKKVVYYNLELSATRVMQIIINLGFNPDKLMKNLVIINERPLNMSTIIGVVLGHQAQALFIDVFSCLLTKASGHRIPLITEDLATKFSYFPEKYGCAVFVTEQLIKERMAYKRPTENEIKGGSALCHKASKIILVYRHTKEHLEKLMQDDLPNIAAKVTELLVRKDRFGRCKEFIQLYKLSLGFHGLDSLDNRQYCDFVFKGR
jgi:hypothetical protein